MRQTQEVRSTCSGHSGGSSGAQVADFKHQPHGGVQWYPLITGQSQHLYGRKQDVFTRCTVVVSSCTLNHALGFSPWIVSPAFLSSFSNVLSITGTRCHFLSHPPSTNSLLLSSASDESNALSYSRLNTDSANNNERKKCAFP